MASNTEENAGKKLKVLVVIGTRPNFIKITRFRKVVSSFPQIDLKILHTGQHFDQNMAGVFFQKFGLNPDYIHTLSSTTPASQLGEIMMNIERTILNDFHPSLMLVVGDVNSTLAASLVANKMGIKMAHVESGLRSFDRTMPEEINRIITDEICDYFFVTEKSGWDNLITEGISPERMVMTGNTMIDTLVHFDDLIEQEAVLEKHGLEKDSFVLFTMHRPANVDFAEGLNKLLQLFLALPSKYKLVFPVHPRTRNRMKEFGLYEKFESISNLILTEPMDYFSFQKLIKYSKMVITDSGGVQEETTFRQVPCFTIRPNTERPVTVDVGTNTLVPFDAEVIMKLFLTVENGSYKKGSIPEKWDGKSTERIFEFIRKQFAL